MPLPPVGPPNKSPLDGPPPLPPTAPPAKAPTYGALTGGAQPGPMGATPGGAQIMDKAVQIAYEVEMALKLLAQAVPQLGPFVMSVVPELRNQLSQALASGLSASAAPQGNMMMPDGSGNL